MEPRRIEIVQEFKGFIGTTEFDDKLIFNSTQFLVEHIENRFMILVSDEFIKEFSGDIDRYIFKAEGLILSEFENELVRCILDEDISSFEQLSFSVYGDDYRFADLNKQIADGQFSYTSRVYPIAEIGLDI
jgi:hypothetical protein